MRKISLYDAKGERHMKVLSLFDGISCGRQALENGGHIVECYDAYEIDEYAISVSRYNHPYVNHLGDILDWELTLPETEYDLVLAGSPCQSFSFAGNQLAFDDQRGKLFFVAMNIMLEVLARNPDVKFIFENVKMAKRSVEIFDLMLGSQNRYEINSALFSAQNRPRLYWTNIPITPPERINCRLSDVLEQNVPDSMDLSEKALNYMNRKVADGRDHWEFAHHSDTLNEKSAAVVANWRKGVPYNVLALRNGDGIVERVRHFTPREAERLQTLPDDYTRFGVGDTYDWSQRKEISKTQRFKMIGNGWTVAVIEHILGGM